MNNVSHGNGEANRAGGATGESPGRDSLAGTRGGTVADFIKNAGADSGGTGGVENKGEHAAASGDDGRNSRRDSRRSRKDRSGNQADNRGSHAATAGGDDGRAATSEPGRETKPDGTKQERSAEAVPRVEKLTPKKVPLVVLPGGKKPESLSEDFIAELWKMLYQIPHLAGYDDAANPWWPLAQHEANALASPSARIIARLTPAEQELFSRFADPIALVVTAVAITSFRAEMTREYVKAVKVQRAVDARRAGTLRGTSASDIQGDRRNNGESSERTPADAEGGITHSHELIKDTFGES